MAEDAKPVDRGGRFGGFRQEDHRPAAPAPDRGAVHVRRSAQLGTHPQPEPLASVPGGMLDRLTRDRPGAADQTMTANQRHDQANHHYTAQRTPQDDQAVGKSNRGDDSKAQPIEEPDRASPARLAPGASRGDFRRGGIASGSGLTELIARRLAAVVRF